VSGSPSAIRLVTFEAGGTLLHPHPTVGAIYAEVLTRRGFPCDPREVGQAFERAWVSILERPSIERYGRAANGERRYWSELLSLIVEELGGAEAPEGAADELFDRFARPESWRVFPEVPAILEELSQRGLQMAVVSNWDSRLPALLRDLGLRAFFGPILVSALEACEKPDPRIFWMAAERAGVSPEEALHVGDQDREDLEGARGAGFHALKIERDAGGGPGLEAVIDWLDRSESPRRESRR
jgi:putative hydrolase of the HAD superfamily